MCHFMKKYKHIKSKMHAILDISCTVATFGPGPNVVATFSPGLNIAAIFGPGADIIWHGGTKYGNHISVVTTIYLVSDQI